MLMLYEEEIVVTRIVASESRNKEREERERERNEEANTANYFSTDSAR